MALINPNLWNRDGCGTWFTLINQSAQRDKWEAEIIKHQQLLHSQVWKSQNNLSLQQFTAQHHNAYISLSQCVEHVPYQLLNEYSTVGLLLQAIQHSDA